MRIYKQKTGELFKGDLKVSDGYSGFGPGKNNPLAQHIPNVGPIPQGAYLIGEPSQSQEHGPVSLHLLPLVGTQTFGRGGFLMHGDSIAAPGTASRGCIIADRAAREAARDDSDRLLIVISGNR